MTRINILYSTNLFIIHLQYTIILKIRTLTPFFNKLKRSFPFKAKFRFMRRFLMKISAAIFHPKPIFAFYSCKYFNRNTFFTQSSFLIPLYKQNFHSSTFIFHYNMDTPFSLFDLYSTVTSVSNARRDGSLSGHQFF